MPLPDPIMVVCIDGPLRGRLRAVTGSQRTRFSVYDQPSPVPPHPGGDWNDVIIPTLEYHVHIISFLGFGIRVASMQLTPDKIDPYDVISTLFNEAARQATYRSNGG